MLSLNRQVLILNQNYEPMSVIAAKKAVVLLYLGKVEIIEHHSEYIHSVSRAFPYPSIVRLMSFISVPRKRVVLSRKNVLKRDNHRCQYCGSSHKMLTVDHVIPKNRDGDESWENLVCACVQCNNRKGNRTPEEAGMHLSRRPQKPNHLFYIQHFVGMVDERWKPYLFMN